MVIREIQKIGIITTVIGSLLILLFSFKLSYSLLFIFGSLASNLSLYINKSFLDLTGTRSAFAKNFSSFILRMILYALTMSLAFLWQDTLGLIMSFIGCLVIRISILIYGIKGGIVDGHFK